MNLPVRINRIDTDRPASSKHEIVWSASVREPSIVHARTEEADARLRSVRRRFRTIRQRYERSRRRPAIVRFALVVVAVAALGFAGVAAFLLVAG